MLKKRKQQDEKITDEYLESLFISAFMGVLTDPEEIKIVIEHGFKKEWFLSSNKKNYCACREKLKK